MRVLIVSDIHGNLPALEAVLRDSDAAGEIDAVWCLGDTVGYGPQPSECIARLESLGAVWVAGNHERAVTGAMGTEEFNPNAAAAARWTAKMLSDSEKTRLDALPEVVKQDGVTLVHGTLRDPLWEYLYSEEAALGHLALQETSLGLVGHTHIPMVAVQQPGRSNDCRMNRVEDGQSVQAGASEKLVFNPGSVGQPRDGDPRASYAVYDTEAQAITLHRVEYEVEVTQKLMEEARLPRWLIERLSVGR